MLNPANILAVNKFVFLLSFPIPSGLALDFVMLLCWISPDLISAGTVSVGVVFEGVVSAGIFSGV